MDELHQISAAGISIFAAMLLAQAAWHKLSQRQAFASALRDYQMLSDKHLMPATLLFASVEAGLALLLLSPFNTLALHKTAILLALYAMAMSIALLRGQRLSNCACGSLQEKHALGAYQVLRNIVLIALLLVASRVAAFEGLIAVWQWLLAFVVAIVLVLLYAMADQIHINYQNKKQLDLRYE